MPKNERFQIMIEIGDSTIIAKEDKKKGVEEWVKSFHEQNIPSSTLKVFERNEIGSYRLIHSAVVPSDKPTERLIGFGRW